MRKRRRHARPGRWRRRFTMVAALCVLAALPAAITAVRCAFHPRAENAGVPSFGPAIAATIPEYQRPGAATYFTLPGWLIVYQTDEYGAFLAHGRPSGFPYFRAAVQFWSTYNSICDAACGSFPFDRKSHVMLAAVGTSYSIENLFKGIYENSVGRITEAIDTNDTDEDRFAARTVIEYGRFMHARPWYEFPFRTTLTQLWSETPKSGPHAIRKWERRFVLSLEYGMKAVYGSVIRAASTAAYGDAPPWTYASATHVPQRASKDSRIKKVAPAGDDLHVLALQRYEPFTEIASALATQGMQFTDIAGNQRVFITAIASASAFQPRIEGSRLIFSTPLLTSSEYRIGFDVPVRELGNTVSRLKASGVLLEHIYDF